MNEAKENDKRVQDRFDDDVSFSYDALRIKVTVPLQNNAELNLAYIRYILGFSSENVLSETSTGDREADLEYSFHVLFIYYDIIRPPYVS